MKNKKHVILIVVAVLALLLTLSVCINSFKSNKQTKKTVQVGNGATYTSVLKALIDNGENIVIELKSGIYNIADEYKAQYGNDYFDNYAGFYTSNVFDRGLNLANGVEIRGEKGAVLLFDYLGGNETVYSSFSVLALTNNNVVDGITIEVNRNCQYLIHDDFANPEISGKNIIKNCIFKGVQCSTSVIGAGFGKNMSYEIRNNLFLQDYSSQGYESPVFEKLSIMYHSCAYSDEAESKIIISGNRCSGGINLWKTGNSQMVSKATVYNNSATEIVCKDHPRYPGNDNIKMRSFFNRIKK